MVRERLDNPDLPLSKLFLGWPELAEVFLSRHLICFGCPIAPFHTVIDTCGAYGLDEAEFRAALQARLATVRL